ncbi:MAG: biosynthetic-type acetolactate synthase large subunit [Spirochaetaceae bacterium]|nr:MAG: biosynthetic-type acetolactate synthase large subunit [Spirochaetaceae bacterium]
MGKVKLSGAKALIRALESQGVEVIFGYPGGATLPIYDELAKSSIRHILARHEQGAAHMADGYARATGKTGVCMATSGPGATNLVTGLANAYMDSSPLIAITGQVPRPMIGNDAFQEVDITGITIPITKHNYLLQEASEIPHTVQEAFYLASTGRRGPVLLDIPRDVQQEIFSPHQAKYPPLEGYRPTVEGHPGQIKRAVSLLKAAEKPVIIAGGGVSLSAGRDQLVKLAEKADMPVVHTLMGKASYPNTHPLCLGLMGYHGRVESNYAISHADVILALGTRFGDRSTGPINTFAKQAKIIHIDIDPAEISKNVPSYLPIVGDASQILEQLVGLVSAEKHTGWIAELRQIAAQHPLRGKATGVSIPNILRILQTVVEDPIIVTDVGRHQIFTAHYFPVDSSRSFITSGGLGTMGFGVPAAIGARVGQPERTVVDIAGDGSFMMTCQEIASAVTEEIPVVVLVMNDYCLGMIKQLQDAFYGKRYEACRFGRNVDFARLAESMGAAGFKVTRESEIAPNLKKALAAGRTAVVDCVLEEPSNVYPMVTGLTLMEYVE